MCEHVERLREQGYVDGTVVYLQNLNIPTNFTEDLKTASHCLYCGLAITDHPPSFDISCIGYRNAHLSNQFDSHLNSSSYKFNLVTAAEYARFNTGDPNHPERSTLPFCPYCGERQERNQFIQNK